MTVSLSDSVYLGQKVASMELDDALTITRVNLDVDSENYYTSGDDSGSILNVECPWATQSMADSILSAVSGYTYRPYTATDALLDPAVELGDAVTVGGIYSIIASLDIDYRNASIAEISAPALDEIDDEYPYITQERKETNKVLTQARSIISKTADEIILRVEGELEGVENTVTELSVTLDGVMVTDSSGTTYIKGSSIETETLYVSAANITGTLTAEQINLSGAISWGDLDSSTQAAINSTRTTADSAYNLANSASQTVSSWSYNGTTYINGTMLMTGTVTATTLRGGTVSLLASSGSTSGYITIGSADTASYAVELISYAAMRIYAQGGTLSLSGNGVNVDLGDGYIGCGRTLRPAGDNAWDVGTSSWRWGTVYAATATIQTSDRNYKSDINYDMAKYDAIFDALKPASFKFVDGTSGRTHTGFVSQDIESSLVPCGLTSLDFAAYIKSPKTDERGVAIEGEYIYGLRYEELMALAVAQIQSLKARVATLEARIIG